MNLSKLVRRIPTFLRLFWSAIAAWWNDDVMHLGASLAYYTLFAIAPILVIAIAIAGLAFGDEAVRGEITGQLTGLMGAQGAEAIQTVLQGASEKKAGIVAAVAGSVTTLLAATGAFLELQTALNHIFRAHPRPGAAISTFMKVRLRSFGLVVAIGFLLLVSLAVSTALAAAASWLERTGLGWPLLWQIANIVVSLGVITVLFALLYRFLPDRHLAWRDVWVGAFATSILFTVGKQLIGLYLGQSSTASSFGAAGSIVVVLLWVYYSSQIVLIGAEYTRLYARSRRFGPGRAKAAIRDEKREKASPQPSPRPASARDRRVGSTR